MNFPSLKRIGLAALSLVAIATAALATTYSAGGPSQYPPPTYIPTIIGQPITLTAAGDVTFNTSGSNTVAVRITGTHSVLAGKVQVTNDALPTPTNYTDAEMLPVGGGAKVTSFSDNGFWIVNTAGMTQVRVHVTSLTGTSITVRLAGSFSPGGVTLTNPNSTSNPTTIYDSTATYPWVIDSSGVASVKDTTHVNTDTAALSTFAATAASTVNSADQTNLYGKCVNVVVDLTTMTAASVVTTIQGKDAASGKYYTLLAGAAKTSTGTTRMTVCPGTTETTNVAASYPLPKVWRVSTVISDNSGTAAVTGTIGASVVE